MKRLILLILISVTLMHCSTIQEPKNDEATLLIGQIMSAGKISDYRYYNLNGINKSGIEITIENKETKNVEVLKSNFDGIFYSTTLLPGEYAIKKFFIDKGASYFTLLNSLNDFTLTKGKVNNLGIINWELNFNESSRRYLNKEYSELQKLFLSKYPESAWLRKEWIAVDVHPEKSAMTSVSKINIIWRGIYKSEIIREIENKDYPNNIQRIISDTPTRIKDTKIIPLQIGTCFGIIYEIIGEPKGSYVNISKVIIFPDKGLKDPTKIEILKNHKSVLFPVIGKEHIEGYRLLNDWELVPGEWKIQLWSGDKKYAEETFTLIKPSSESGT
jgi:hypothetical protein